MAFMHTYVQICIYTQYTYIPTRIQVARLREGKARLEEQLKVLAVRDEAAAHAHLSLAALKADNERLVSEKEALGHDRDKALDAGAVLLEEKRGWQVRGEVV